MKELLLSCFALCASAAFADGEPLIVPDYNRDVSAMCGSAQALEDGTLVIGWGGATRDADSLSVITNGVTQMRVTLADPTDFTYRAVYCPPATSGRVPLGPGEKIVRDTAEEASNVLKRAEFAPSAAVTEKLGAGSPELDEYRGKFKLDVVPTSDGKWAVAAFLLPVPWTEVVESAQEATRQIPLAAIAALEEGAEMKVKLEGCGVPGFYYSFYSGSAVTNLRALAAEKGRNVLCGADRELEFSGVVKPIGTAGFFSIGVKDTPGVMPGSDGVPVPPVPHPGPYPYVH